MRLTIGTLARRVGSNVETVRYYERIGLLPEPPRSLGGHRLYGEEHARRLAFIRRSRALGFSVDEVRGLLAVCDSGDYTCAEVKARTLEHRASVRRKIAALERLDDALSAIAARCAGDAGRDCPILETLFGDGVAAGDGERDS
jgi:MerR family transcriptional regulator, mercuric resistance operon regulatory protein